MTLEKAFTDAGTIEHGSGSPISGGVFVIASAPDLKISIQGLGVFFGSLAFTFSGGSAPGFVNGTVVGGGTIVSTATHVRTADGFVVREGDTGTLNATGTLTGGGAGSVSGPVELGDPGQTKWSAE